jgi:hypothetical protein
MWAKFDDGLIDHPKIGIAGDVIGKNGRAIALGFYAGAVIWSNKHLTDGFVPVAIVKHFLQVENGTAIADALTRASLFEKVDGGFQVHDFGDHNPSAAKVKKKRREDARRKREERELLEAAKL